MNEQQIPKLQYPVEIESVVEEFKEPEQGLYSAFRVVELANRALRAAGVELTVQLHGEQVEIEIVGDDELIDYALDQASVDERTITDAAARVIATQLHGGQNTAMYSFASTGAIDREGLAAEIAIEQGNDGHARKIHEWLSALWVYIVGRRDVGPVEGWSKLWLEDKR